MTPYPRQVRRGPRRSLNPMPTDIFIKRSGSLEVQHRKVETLDLAALQKELDIAE